jgi:hypothetical protein
MGILPMSLTGVPPVSFLLFFCFPKEETEETTDTGKMPVRLMGETPMLRPKRKTLLLHKIASCT